MLSAKLIIKEPVRRTHDGKYRYSTFGMSAAAKRHEQTHSAAIGSFIHALVRNGAPLLVTP